MKHMQLTSISQENGIRLVHWWNNFILMLYCYNINDHSQWHRFIIR